MRVMRVLAGISAVGILVPAISFGCINPEDNCVRARDCPPPGAGATGMGTGGSDAGTSPMCIPSQAEGAVDDKCGIFVSATVGNDANSGTKGSPVATIGHAILEANGTNRPIFVCNETYTEVVEAPAGIEIYGGLDCANGWTWSEAGRTTLTAAADSVPLKLTSGMGVTRVENFAVMAADAIQAGGSSIAAIIDNVTAEIAHCELTAGLPQNGSDGQPDPTPALQGIDGKKGTDACGAVMGGEGGTITCDGVLSQGGTGGPGGMIGIDSENGQPGMAGQPEDGVNGLGGSGQTDPMGVCLVGSKGKDGDPGALGLGGSELGTLSISGITGGDGKNGGNGTPGQGGGGGGGAKAGTYCVNGTEGPGASGGGGGSGGCGGKGGLGGQAGGSSIGLISLNAKLSLTQVTLTARDGAGGGNGAFPQVGALPGNGESGGNKGPVIGSKIACKGGDGGAGGDGGPGGGGRGGHSLGIAFRGNPPPAEGYTITPGVPGNGGVGATMDPTGAGANGTASPTPVEFP